MINNDRVISDAVHVRTWLLRLSEGHRINIMPGSEDHIMLMNVVKCLDERLMTMRAQNKKRKTRRLVLVDPVSIKVRDSRDRKRAHKNGMIDKYFKIYSEEEAV